MKTYLFIALITLLLQACNKSGNYQKSEEASLSKLTERIFDKFLDQEFEQILTLTGKEEIHESVAVTIKLLMEFVRAEHPESEFQISVESWEESVHAKLLPGMVNNRALEYRIRPEGVIVIKWTSADGLSENSLSLAYKVENGLYSLAAPQYS